MAFNLNVTFEPKMGFFDQLVLCNVFNMDV